MGLPDEIRELKELRDNGTLTDAEFTKAKSALLADSASGGRRSNARVSQSGATLGEAAKTWVNLQVVMAIVGVAPPVEVNGRVAPTEVSVPAAIGVPLILKLPVTFTSPTTSTL